MNMLDKLFPVELYHSYIIEGDRDLVTPLLQEFLIARNLLEPQSPNLLCQIYDVFTIADSELIKEWHNASGGEDTKSICIIATSFINHDAERTLLKILEEPKNNAHFFIVVPNAGVLLDTICSRAHIVKVAGESDLIYQKKATAFIKSSPKERLDMVASIVEENKDNENSGKLRFVAIALVNALEEIIYKRHLENKEDQIIVDTLQQLHNARTYLGTPGASVKMILEHIALVL